ncbi:MAG: penicillin-binding protein 2 [Desulfobacterales bacterium C00003104]|nr:MAG: penicillin-binding protein 2 [Desulfobacterales bacterium C00003104]
MANDLFGTVETDWYRTRLNRVLACILAGFFILASGLYYLQIIRGEELRRVAENNYVRLENIFPPRGLIYDRNGKLLVDNRPCFDVSIILEDAPDPENVMRRVALLLSMPETALLEKIKEINRSKPFKPILLKSDISRDELAVIKTRRFDLPGVVVSVEPRRHYVMGDYASHLIGYLGEISERELRNGSYPDNRGGDFIGKFGIEKTCDSYFWGKRGGRQVVVDALGRTTDTLSTVDPKPGKTVYLSIDGRLQKVAEDMLRKKTAGAVLAMNPNNGHILAMASHPCFDQNALVEGMSYAEWEAVVKDPLHPLENKGIQGQYPPGSIYKIVTAMAALEEGVVTEETTSYCPGFYTMGKSRFRCWKRHGHGLMTLREAMAESCDVFFYKAGEMVGVDRLAYYARGCGLGARTGIRLGNEAAGLVPTKDWKQRRFHSSWQKGETLIISIGQGYNLVTPVQAVSLIAAVANGGVRYAPVIIKEIRDSDGRLIETTKSKIVGRLPASEETLAIIRRGLEDAVNTKSGTGWAVRLSGGVMAGKTGTAQVVRQEGDRGKKQEDIPFRFRDHAWFCAYGPTQAPRIAVAVLVEHGEHGSSAAGPIAAEIIKTYLELYP